MSGNAVSSAVIGAAIPSDGSDYSLLAVDDTILSQYANSPIIRAIIESWSEAFRQDVNVDAFYDLIWNIETAQGYGLDVLGRIVGVNRVLRIPAQVPYIGWASDDYNWGNGIWYGLGTATQNYFLTDDAFRRLVLAKAALNICDGSIPTINQALLTLFPDAGNCYVSDDGGMSMTYVFGSDLTPVEYAIVTQSGVLPKPVGVTVGAAQP